MVMILEIIPGISRSGIQYKRPLFISTSFSYALLFPMYAVQQNINMMEKYLRLFSLSVKQ